MKILDIIRRQQILIIVAIILILGIIGITYASFINEAQNNENQVLTTADLDVTYGAACSALSGEISALTDQQGLAQDGCDISFTNHSTTNLYYTINLFNDIPADFNGELVDAQYIKFSLDNGPIHTLSEYTEVNKNNVNVKEIYDYIVAPNGTVNHNVKIWLDSNIPDSEDSKYIYVNAKIISGNTDLMAYNIVNDQGTVGVLDLGDEISIGSEHFYVLERTATETKLLSKYDLLVGYKCHTESNYSCDDLANPTGIQDETAVGSINWPSMASINFSTTNYWPSSSAGQYVYNANSILYPYVEAYKSHLESIGGTVSSARLMTLAEVDAAGCDSTTSSCADAPDWLVKTSFWTGTAYDSNKIWIVDTDRTYGGRSYDIKYYRGIRPVVIIPNESMKIY